jgi:hypothetical protein
MNVVKVVIATWVVFLVNASADQIIILRVNTCFVHILNVQLMTTVSRLIENVLMVSAFVILEK